MTVDVTRIGESVYKECYVGVDKCEETPTFLKLTGNGLINLIPLKDILEVVIHDS